jgi:hypothetical protein
MCAFWQFYVPVVYREYVDTVFSKVGEDHEFPGGVEE